jgi:hypothetical protein
MSHVITTVIDAKQKRDIITANIPNAFVQTDIKEKGNSEWTIMKIRGQLVNMLVNIALWVEKNQKALCVEMMKALYGMLQLSLLYNKKFLGRLWIQEKIYMTLVLQTE